MNTESRAGWIRPFLALLATFVITGCAAPVSIGLSPEQRQSLKNVHVTPDVPKPGQLYWRGTAQAWGAVLGGAIGAAFTHNSGATDAENMAKWLGENKIDVSEMVHAEAVSLLTQRKTYALVSADQADATLRLSVDMYGFNKTHPFGSNMNPLIRITGKLVRPNQDIVWQETEFVSDFAAENDQGQPMDTYLKEPEKLRAALAKASSVAVRRLLAKLP